MRLRNTALATERVERIAVLPNAEKIRAGESLAAALVFVSPSVLVPSLRPEAG
jgi:hypothetical protein